MFFAKLKNAALYALGSRTAEGHLNRIHLVEQIENDWRVYQGEQGVEANFGNISRFLKSQHNVDMRNSVNPLAFLTKKDRIQLWQEMARIILENRHQTVADELGLEEELREKPYTVGPF